MLPSARSRRADALPFPPGASFPSLPNLSRLLLADNRISGGLEHLVTAAPLLESLSLSSNPLQNLEALRPLAALAHLHRLDVEACPLAKVEGYRAAIFEMMPQLESVDGLTLEGEPVDDEEDEEDDEDEGEWDDDEPGTAFLLQGDADALDDGEDFTGEDDSGSDGADLDEDEEEEEAPAAKKAKA